MSGNRDPIPPGTLDLLILRTLNRHPRLHGFEIAESIQAISGEILIVEEGSLYPALQRMLLQGWIEAEWGRTEENRRARYYQLTEPGRRQMESELARYERVSGAIGRVIAPGVA